MDMNHVYQGIAILVFIITTLISYFLLEYKLFISNIFVISSYLLIVPTLFFTYGAYIEKQIVKTQIVRIIQELKDSADAIGVSIPKIKLQINKSLDAEVEHKNRELIKYAIITLILGSLFGYVIAIYLWWRKPNFNVKHMIIRDFLLLFLIIVTEILFFTVITKNYRTIDANMIKYTILNDLTEKSKPKIDLN